MTSQDRNEDRTRTLLAILAGILVALLTLLLIVWATRDSGSSGADSTVPAAATTAPATTTTVTTTPATTTTGATTTTAATTTTVSAFGGDTATKSNLTVIDDPGPNLTDVRVGDHPGFVRVVFDLTGEGTPLYIVGYESGPSFEGSGGGDPVTPDGNAFLVVHINPALTYDIDTFALTYTGDLAFDPGFSPIEEIAFVDDFEADMFWVIGLTEEKPFTVQVLQSPLRLVVDIGK